MIIKKGKHSIFLLIFLLLIITPGIGQLKLVDVVRHQNYGNQALPHARTSDLDTLALPFFDDFSTIEGIPDPGLWLFGENVFINKTLAINPPTLGVATFDGAKANGGIYDADPFLFGLADSLISKPVNLSTLLPSEINTVYLSFFWQFFGRAEIPNDEDSLMLSFKTQEGAWELIDVFNNNNIIANDTFQQVIYRIEQRFLHDSFQFKFENIARLSGSYDAWHIDYIYLDKNRSITDRAYFDRAITDYPDYVFKGYSAMPIKQFFAAPEKYQSSSDVDIYNLDVLLQPIEYSAFLINTNEPTDIIDTLNYNTEVNPILQGLERRTLNTSSLDYNKLDADADSIYMTLNFYISSGDTISPNGIDYRINDTTSFDFVLHNYYATDDGTAEFGLGMEQLSAKLAYRFVLEESDVLNSVDIYFPNIVRNQSGTGFDLYVWKKLSNEPEDVLYVRENQSIQPISEVNQFQTIQLPEIFVSDTFYVGYEQRTNLFMAVGYDKNHDNGEDIFYNIGGDWIANTEHEGSLMIRPYFGNYGPTTSLEKPVFIDRIKVYPNPSKGVFNIKGEYDSFSVTDMMGRVVYSENYKGPETTVYLSNLKSGIYLLRFVNKGRSDSRRIIIHQ